MANWAAIGALGTAAEGAGNYFGQVHMERKKAERLAEVRAQQLEDKADNRAHNANLLKDSNERDDRIREEGYERTDEVTASNRAHQAKLLSDSQEYDADRLKEDRFYAKLDLNEQREYDKLTLDEQREWQKQKDADDLKIENEQWSGEFWTADEASGDKSGKIYKVMNDGSRVETQFSEMTDGERYESKVYTDAKAARKVAAEAGLDLTESQSKVMIHFGNGASAINDMNKALNIGGVEGAAGTKESLIRQIGEGGVTTAWLEGETAQLYNQAAYVALEATLRHKSGAALKTDEIVLEAKKYQIEVGNSAAVIAQKMESLHRAVYLMGDTLPAGARDMALSRMSSANYTDPDEQARIMSPKILGANGVPVSNFGGSSTSRAGNESTIPVNESTEARMAREFGGG